MNAIDIGKVAAYFDGEGCVYIATHNNAKHELRVQISSSCKAICEYIKDILGFGCVTRSNNYVGTGNTGKSGRYYKPMYIYFTTCRKALAFLRIVEQHVIDKREQVKIAIEFQERLMSKPRAGVNGVSKEELEIREKYRQLLSALKKSGVEEKSSNENCVNSVELSTETIPSQAVYAEGVTTRDAASERMMV